MRARLALIGFLTVMVPVSVLLAVALQSDRTTVTEERSADKVDIDVVVVKPPVSPWVPLTAAGLVLPVLAMTWWWAGRAVRPIQHMTSVANEIQSGSLDQRIAVIDAPIEIRELAHSFDNMLERLAAASTAQQQLIEDTGHDLRTPLAALAVNIELLVDREDLTLDDYRNGLERANRSMQRLRQTIEQTLTDAEVAMHLRAQDQNDLVAIVENVVQRQQQISPSRRIEVTAPDSLHAGVDGVAVARALSNLVDNADRHSPPDGLVLIEVGYRDRLGFVAVADEGPGLNDDEPIFERYWQGDPDRGEGRGIGLAIVKQVAEAHQGIDVESPVTIDGGSRFIMWFSV